MSDKKPRKGWSLVWKEWMKECLEDLEEIVHKRTDEYFVA